MTLGQGVNCWMIGAWIFERQRSANKAMTPARRCGGRLERRGHGLVGGLEWAVAAELSSKCLSRCFLSLCLYLSLSG